MKIREVWYFQHIQFLILYACGKFDHPSSSRVTQIPQIIPIPNRCNLNWISMLKPTKHFEVKVCTLLPCSIKSPYISIFRSTSHLKRSTGAKYPCFSPDVQGDFWFVYFCIQSTKWGERATCYKHRHGKGKQWRPNNRYVRA